MRQRQCQSHSDAHRAAHHTDEEVPFVIREVRPFDTLPALRSDNQLIRHFRGEKLQACVANHMENSPAKSSAIGLLSAFIARTASLIFISSFSPSSSIRYSIPKPWSIGMVRLPIVE